MHEQITLIWDLGGVLFKSSARGIAYEIGLGKFLWYVLRDFKHPNITSLVFNVLASLNNQNNQTIGTRYNGYNLPPIMNDWLAGIQSGPDIIILVNAHIADLYKNGYFVSKREKELVASTIYSIFDPRICARYMYPIKPAIKLLKKCAQARTPEGIPKNRLMILSNFDALTFNYLYKAQTSKKIFDYFKLNNIVISGNIGYIKPQLSCFKYIISTYKLNPAICIFIDDQEHNVHAAQACGIKGIVLKNSNYTTIEDYLKMQGAI